MKGEKIMLERLHMALEKPLLYAKSESAFWNDEYISKQMLKAHLNPDFEGASRKLDFIEKSVAWISEIVNPIRYPMLLDIGCGPGIYAERFAKEGYGVTGIDFSKRSINYAQESALRQGLNITYLFQDYLEMDLENCFDFATMIYCDYGALSKSDRQVILRNVYQNLKSGGKFLFDVFGTAKYNAFTEGQTWKICNGNGFWHEGSYLEMSGSYKYGDYVTLEQTAIILENEINTYYIWNTCFSKEVLIAEVEEAGFKVCDIFGDMAGSPYSKDSFTIAIFVEK